MGGCPGEGPSKSLCKRRLQCCDAGQCRYRLQMGSCFKYQECRPATPWTTAAALLPQVVQVHQAWRCCCCCCSAPPLHTHLGVVELQVLHHAAVVMPGVDKDEV